MVSPRHLLVKAAQGVFWVVLFTAAYIAAQYVVAIMVWLLSAVGVSWNTASTTGLLTYRVAVYLATAGLIALAVWYRYRTVSLRDIALERLIRWKDVGLSALGAVAYVVLTFACLTLASKLFSVDIAQTQDLGFTQLLYGPELLTAFIVLVILTPIFEEVFFRGFLYGRLRALTRYWWVPALIVSALFGIAHGQWNVAIDVFCLSMVACALRELTGSIWAGILLHIAKNMIAFFGVFVYAAGIIG